MEETLGKRIAGHRRRLGLTQDALADLVGVTAQAVSKWENDQSCPDIATLPKLAEIFGITTDELLGIERRQVHEAEIVTEDSPDGDEPEGLHLSGGDWEFQWDSGRKGSLGLGLWVLISGALLLLSNHFRLGTGLWDILWPTGLLVFGLLGLWPDFSFFRLGCSLFGGYFLASNMHVLPGVLGKEMLLPTLLVLFGLSLLVDALKRPKKHKFHVKHNGKTLAGDSGMTLNGNTFYCATSFGENSYLVELPRLEGGRAQVSFGEMTVDLRGCEEISAGCELDLNCSFGELTLLVPRSCRLDVKNHTAFANVEVVGQPDPGAKDHISAACDVSFGNVTLKYV